MRIATLACLGHAYVGLQQWDRAKEAYQQVIAMLSDMPQLAMEGLAGLAYVCWRQGQVEAACKYVDHFLSLLERVEITGYASPNLSYERVATVLHEMGRTQDAKRVWAQNSLSPETGRDGRHNRDVTDRSA